MNKIVELLYHYKIIKISQLKIDEWLETKNSTALLLGLKFGKYHERISSIQGLVTLNAVEYVDNIAQLMFDPVQAVSEEAILAVERLTNDLAMEMKVKGMKAYWKMKTYKKALNSKALKKLANQRLSFHYEGSERAADRLLRKLDAQRQQLDSLYGF